MALVDKLKNIGDAIRLKNGSTDAMTLDEMVASIEALQIGTIIEKGSFKPSSYVKTYNISWSKTHDKLPSLFIFKTDGTLTYDGSYYNSGFIVCPLTVLNRFCKSTSYAQVGYILIGNDAGINDPSYKGSSPYINWLTTSGCTCGGTLSAAAGLNFKGGVTYEWAAIWV